MAAFPASPLPNYPIEETSVEPEILITSFRDGSEQRRAKGAGRKRKFRLRFGSSLPITVAEKGFVVTHYAGQQGTLLSFTWTHPETAEAITCRYAGPPTWTHVGYQRYEGSVELQEVPS